MRFYKNILKSTPTEVIQSKFDWITSLGVDIRDRCPDLSGCQNCLSIKADNCELIFSYMQPCQLWYSFVFDTQLNCH